MSTDDASPTQDQVDSSRQFCLDFAGELEGRRISVRRAADVSGWSKSMVDSAKRGPNLPNAQLVTDVLIAIGLEADETDRWRRRHEALSTPPSPASSTNPSSAAPVAVRKHADHSAETPPGPDAESARPSTPATWVRPALVIVALVALVFVVVTVVLVIHVLTPSPSHTLVVQNKVASGSGGLSEDDSPSYLASRPIRRCANVPGCKLPGTDLRSGDTVKAVCQLQAVAITNADVESPGIRDNPNVAASALWYGVDWTDGRRGYLSEVYVAATDRGGLGLPDC